MTAKLKSVSTMLSLLVSLVASQSLNYKVTLAISQNLYSDCSSWGCSLTSPTNKYFAMMQHDCQFAVYTSGTNAQVFKAPTYLGDGHQCFLAPQANGQLIVYQNATGTPAVVYAFNKAPANPAASYSLNMQDDGNLVWSDNNGLVVWSINPVTPLFTITNPSTIYNAVMNGGSTLNSDCNSFGCGISSPNGDYLAVMQHDCLFAIYTADIKTQLYKTNTYQGGTPKCFLAGETNGQLVVFKTLNGVNTKLQVLNPNTVAKFDNYTLTLGDSGNLIWADSK
ncbi:hypothetical protein HDV01_003388, partial [Terramyces sp. JEL0728]